MIRPGLSLAALAATLALAGCNKAPETTDNAAVNVSQATDLGDTPANDETPVIENVAAGDTQAVAVPALPKPAKGASAEEAAPLSEAVTIEDDIRAGRRIQRVRYGEGWAWMRGKQIVRTADRDGSNVAYFHPGDANPFLVQHGDHAFAYRGDKPVREFDRDGKPATPDQDHAKQAQDAARDARAQHDHAEQARDHAKPPSPDDRDRGDKGDNRDDHRGDSSSSSSTPDKSPGHGWRDRNPDDGNSSAPRREHHDAS